MNSSSILVVDDDESLRRVIQVQLERVGYRVGTAPNGEKALSLLRQTPYDLAITDLRMPGLSGLDLLRRIRSDHPDVIVVMMTAFATIETAVEAMRAGAYDYVTKPVHPDELRMVIGRALEHLRLREEVHNLL